MLQKSIKKSDSLSSLLFLSLVPEISTQSTVAHRICSTAAIPWFDKGTSTKSDRRLAYLDPETSSERARIAQNLENSRATPSRVRRPAGQPSFGHLFSSFAQPLDDLGNPDLGLLRHERHRLSSRHYWPFLASSAAVEPQLGYHPSVLPCLSST